MKKKTFEFTGWMDENGHHTVDAVDYFNDRTYENLDVPDHMVGMLPVMFAELARRAE